MNKSILWFRKEDKAYEWRVPITPDGVKKLGQAGVEVIVESSTHRVFSDNDYQNAGAKIVNTSWHSAPKNAVIIGLKELAVDSQPIAHRHIYFSHTFKKQKDANLVLQRYASGGGEIFDLEFITHTNGVRVVAFGYWAGYVGAAISLLGFSHYDQNNFPYNKLTPFKDRGELIKTVNEQLAKINMPSIKVMVMGALGRCGSGAVDLINDINLSKLATTSWDKPEFDNANKPIIEIIKHHIFINCVYLREKIEPMITPDLLGKNHQLKIIGDISCDPNNPNNPIAVYNEITHIDAPFVKAQGNEKFPTYILAIDHLPTLLPRESSEEFAGILLPHLIELLTMSDLPIVWQNAKNCFDKAKKDYGLL